MATNKVNLAIASVGLSLVNVEYRYIRQSITQMICRLTVENLRTPDPCRIPKSPLQTDIASSGICDTGKRKTFRLAHLQATPRHGQLQGCNIQVLSGEKVHSLTSLHVHYYACMMIGWEEDDD